MKRAKIFCESICDYELIDKSSEKLYLLLHGYAESAKKIIYKTEHILDQDASILAPNGPFPLPVRLEDRFKLTYAWYFFDTIKKEYYIDHEYPSQFLKGLTQQVQPKASEVIILGFSQGGYLAPFVGQVIKNCKKVICIKFNNI